MIEKNICLPGNVFVVNNKKSEDNSSQLEYFGRSNKVKTNNGLYSNYYDGKYPYHTVEIPVGTKVQIVKFKNNSVNFTIEGDTVNTYQCYWNAFRVKTDKIEGQEIKEPSEVTRYKIYKDGKPLKPKYFNDLGKIKSSLLIEIGYYDNQYEMFEKYKDRNPELQDNQTPEWLGGYGGGYGPKFKRSDCDSIEIMSFEGKSRVPVKTDFDVLAYYDQSMRLINVTAQFGSAARELFKKCIETKDYSYMIVYSPDEYRDTKYVDGYGYNNFDFASLKESQKIKDVMKASGVKGTKKCTKFGKTAIVFKTLDDLKNVMLRLEPKEYFILDCDGEQLVEKNTRFVKLIMLQEVANQEL